MVLIEQEPTKNSSELPSSPEFKFPITYETSVEIISESLCNKGIAYLAEEFEKKHPDLSKVTLVPILRGGLVVGQEIATRVGVTVNPMQMTYAPDGVRLEKPVCLLLPDISEIMTGKVTKIVFTEAVVESQQTIVEAITAIKEAIDRENEIQGTWVPYPEFGVWSLISKVDGESKFPPEIDFVAAFWVHPDIWVDGWGCDFNNQGREKRKIDGFRSLLAKENPKPPYVKILFLHTSEDEAYSS